MSCIIILIFYQLSPFFEQKGEYGLNIDTDVALWLDSREFESKPTLRQACGFVIINSQIHDEFDSFKSNNIHRDYSFLPCNELLDLWLATLYNTQSELRITGRFGKQYVKLHFTEVDKLCKWVLQLRKQFYEVGLDNILSATSSITTPVKQDTFVGQITLKSSITSNSCRKERKRPLSSSETQDVSKRFKQIEKDSEMLLISNGTSDNEHSHSNQQLVTWKQIGGVQVTMSDKEIILNGGWLTDTIIHAAQVLIKKTCKLLPVGCLQNPLLGETLTFDVASEGCVQILHSGGNHWITITIVSKRPSVVRIYDSLNTQLPDSTKKQIASLIFTKEKSRIHQCLCKLLQY